jgi:hypothetical protein
LGKELLEANERLKERDTEIAALKSRMEEEKKKDNSSILKQELNSLRKQQKQDFLKLNDELREAISKLHKKDETIGVMQKEMVEARKHHFSRESVKELENEIELQKKLSKDLERQLTVQTIEIKELRDSAEEKSYFRPRGGGSVASGNDSLGGGSKVKSLQGYFGAHSRERAEQAKTDESSIASSSLYTIPLAPPESVKASPASARGQLTEAKIESKKGTPKQGEKFLWSSLVPRIAQENDDNLKIALA